MGESLAAEKAKASEDVSEKTNHTRTVGLKLPETIYLLGSPYVRVVVIAIDNGLEGASELEFDHPETDVSS